LSTWRDHNFRCPYERKTLISPTEKSAEPGKPRNGDRRRPRETCGRSREQVHSSLASIEGVSASMAYLSSAQRLVLFPTEKTLESPTITPLWILARRFHVG